MERRNFFQTFFASLLSLEHFFAFHKPEYLPENKVTLQKETSDVLVKVLGTAQDGGIPQIGCYCNNCLRARKDPQFSRLISSLAILDLKEKKYFIIDATPQISIQTDMARARLFPEKSDLKDVPHGVFLTHAHIGHYTGLMFFGYEAMSTSKLPVYCSSHMADFLSRNGPWNQLVKLENITLFVLPYDKKFSLTPQASITPFKVPHRDEYSDTLGFKVSGKKKTLLYIPDIQSWGAWERSIEDEVLEVDIALLDGTFFSPEEYPGRDLSKIGHPFIVKSMETLKDIAKKRKTKISFIHLNHSNLGLDPDGEARKEIEEKGFSLASEGMEFAL